MKFLGIDYGKKRIGLATSDEGAMLAFPKEIIPNNSGVFEKIGEVIKMEQISEIVIGESTNFSGEPNTISAEIDNFTSELEKNFEVPIHKQKEFLTSVEARRSRGEEGETNQVDASAAALILQRYLDRRNSPRRAK